MTAASTFVTPERLSLGAMFLRQYESLERKTGDPVAWLQLKFSCTRPEAAAVVAELARIAASSETKRQKTIDDMRGEVEAQVRETRETRERAMDAKYNLLRVSERRYAVVRVSSAATQYHGMSDVVTFEMVTKPLAFDEVLKALREKRGIH